MFLSRDCYSSQIYAGMYSSQDQLDKFIFHNRYDDRDPKVFVKYEQMLQKFISWCQKNEKYGDINDVQDVH